MATTTKSTRKTPAKKAAKSVSAKAPAKTTVKKAAKKPAVKTVKAPKKAATKAVKPSVEVTATSKKQDPKELTPLERLRSMHVTSAIVYLLFAGLVIGFVKTASVAVSLPLQTRDQFASKDSTVLTNANEVLYNIEPKYLLVLSLGFAIISSLLLATKLRVRYESTLANRTSGFRWIVTGLSSAALLSYVYLIAGLNNLWVLKFGGALIMVTALLGWIAERDNAGAVTPRWLAYIGSLFTGTLPWLAVAGTFIGTSLYGNEHFDWSTYAIAGVTLLGFSGFALNQYRHLKASALNKEYVYIEASYFQIDLFTKFAVVLLSLIALK